MTSTIPPSFLFHFALPVHRRENLPRKSGRLLDLSAECALVAPAKLNDSLPFADVRMAWNARGLGIQVGVEGKKRPPRCDASRPEESDGVQVWIDTRNTQSIHRAGRFCHYFCLLPSGGGPAGDVPVAVALPIARAREVGPPADAEQIRLSTTIRSDGWTLEAWIPGQILVGFDTEANPRLGFYSAVRDSQRGEQTLSVGRDFPFTHDPSVWLTLDLVE